MYRAKSDREFSRAQRCFPGGVNSPVRAFGHVGGRPPFIARAQGARVWDVDGNEYIDYVASWGPAILGHAHPAVVAAVTAAAREGLSFGAPTDRESALGELIQSLYPSIQRLRFVSSGTEATMSAIRLARGATGRNKIIKFDGGYHGHADCLLVSAGSGAATCGIPGSAGVTKGTAADTIVCRYNDVDDVARAFARFGQEIAAIIVEPVAGNMGCIPPHSGFLQQLRTICDQHGALFIFDEVMTGFRVHLGGAQALYGITPDITCLGKIVGGGLPVGAYGGRDDLMRCIAPEGPVYQAGTLSGNPLSMAAGLATLHALQQPGVYEQLERTSRTLTDGISAALIQQDIAHVLHRVGSMWSLFFTTTPVQNFADVQRCDVPRFRRYFHFLLERGISLAPSAFEAGFVSLAHGSQEIQHTIDVIAEWAAAEKHA